MAGLSGTQHIDIKNLHGYLKTLPPNILDRLYGHPATCLAVFRELPALARLYVMRMLFVEQPVSHSVVGSWVSSNNSKEHSEGSTVLSELRVWQDMILPGGMPGWILNNTFRNNLKVALLGGGRPWTGTGALNADKHSKDIPFLDQYAVERWECLLHYMVGSQEGVGGISRDVMEILLSSGLMKLEEGSTDPFITPRGFQFLLLDTNSQVWYFILQYLNTCQNRGMDVVETLSFLFQLSFSTFGRDYSTDSMTENQLRFLQHLREIGLVYQRKRKSQRFYPTRLAVNMASGLSQSSSVATKTGYLVVETNYRIYAYTNSTLQVALLALFCDLQYRFPNMVVCNISRNSVREALVRGITAEQIINFLRAHAHPIQLRKNVLVPSTISDQIRLWELERDRFKFNDGVLYSQFNAQSDFEMLRDYAKDLGVLTWENPQRRVMVVNRAGHDEVKRYWKRQRRDNT